MASSSSSSASAPSWKYDVFLNFRGEDTRKNFTDLLYQGLKRFGINTFIDDQLRRGEKISSELLQAIEDSRFSIIIFSQNYAFSSWCLEELIKILECVDKGKHTAFPVFYEVDPSHVRHQRGSYEEAFKKHEEALKNNMKKVVKWRQALTTASKISGWDTRDSYQSEVIDKIVSKIFNEMPRNPSSSNKIGMDSRVQAVLSLLCLGSHDVRMVGIWGMAGIGKTTLAETICQRIHTQFEGYCLLSNVREKSQRIENLQMELLSNILREKNLDNRIFNSGADSIKKALHSKKVLIILDDVNDIKQLEELAGNCNWFGPKSRILITTRNKRLLIEKNVDAIYEVKELERDKALMLFCQHAFKDKHLVEDFKELCDRSLDYTKGNPLAIKILSCLLYKRTKNEWDCELEKLKKFPNKDIQKVLRISFDGLEDTVKDIFLDIACFFKGKCKDYVSELLGCCNLYPEMGIPILIERALITISSGNRLHMHDLIQEMGWEIVRQQSIEDPSKRSRLWLSEDVEDVLTTNTGTKTIQGMVLDLSALEELLDFNVDVFTKMIKLRVLEFRVVGQYYFGGNFPSALYKIHLTGDFKFLSKNLSYLWWEGYPLKFLPSNFNPRKLFELNMSFSRLEQLWEGNKSFGKLRRMNLRHSRDLIKTPDLSGSPELREINLEGCTSLVEVHPSIETLKKLRFLILKNCSKLEELAKSFNKLTSLESVDFDGCLELRKLPDDLRVSHPYLNLSGFSKLEELPESIGEVTYLFSLNLTNCSELKKLPDNVGRSLETLLLSGCSKLEELPKSLGKLMNLHSLDLKDCSKLKGLPKSIGKLTNLRSLDVTNCLKLKKLPNEMRNLQRLVSFVADGSGIQEVPFLTSLRQLSLARCNSINLALSLSSLLPRQEFLTVLILSDCNASEGALSSELSSLHWLEYLDLSGNSFITLPSLTPLTNLRQLRLEGCKSLRSLTKLPPSVQILRASNCESLDTFSHPSNSYAMPDSDSDSDSEIFEFDFSNCGRLLENKESSVSNLQDLLLGIQVVPVCGRTERRFGVLVVGNRIPEWFTHWSQGNSIIVHQLPPDFHALNFLRLAFCVVLGGNLSRWHSDHLWFGIASAEEIQEEMLSHSDHHISHLKFSFSCKEDRKAPLVVKECAIRLLYLLGEEFDNEEESEINEYETVNATSFSPPPTFDKECCWETTIGVDFGSPFYYATSDKHTLELDIEVESYNLKEKVAFTRESEHRKRKAVALIPDLNQFEGKSQ